MIRLYSFATQSYSKLYNVMQKTMRVSHKTLTPQEAFDAPFTKDVGIRNIKQFIFIGLDQMRRDRKFNTVSHTVRVILEEAVQEYWKANPHMEEEALQEFHSIINNPQNPE